ncbi:MAG: alpha-1,6-glucosidase domain-containing protein [Mariniphaga sp.]
MRDWKFNHIDFSIYPNYEGDDLGVFWTPEKTTVKIWAPTAKMVEFRLYKDGKSGEDFHKTQLQASGHGTWSTVLTGDYEGKFYAFRINDGEWLNEVPDIYARCVGVNGIRGMIYNPAKTNPENWENDASPVLKSYTDAVLYETHVRDFSIAKSSGILNKGKFLGFTEENTRTADGLATGLEHLKELGITHVHLLPVNDFATVDEEKPLEKYKWGYDPLDVVYNHTYFAKVSVFNQTVPGYFYRQKADGTFANASGCGNELATERHMVRKYIIDSLKYWVREYHVDGFRFDLMGIIDIKTMNLIRSELQKIKPGLLLYGEGWAADCSPMPEEKRAVKRNLAKLPGIAAFNDDLRDALKGNHSSKKTKGFVSGLELREENVKFGMMAAVQHPQIVYEYVESSKHPWAPQPVQCINYVSCHDNYTLWDKLKSSCPKATPLQMRKMVKLAGAVVLTSQGIPFLHSGSEFCRTKGGNGNSYKSSDAINQIDWNWKKEYYDVFEYYKNLVALRKNHPAFRIPDTSTIQHSIHFSFQYQMGVVSYSIDGKNVGDQWQNIVLIFNGNRKKITHQLPGGKYRVMVQGDRFSNEGLTEVSDTVEVEEISMMILVKA